MSETFCPAKWDEIVTNLNYNYVYACCKAKPIYFQNDFKSIITAQQKNLLENIKDPSCEYCWNVEEKGGKSLRQNYLEKFDKNQISLYNLNGKIKNLEINLGNSCNLQCMYCSPKFSSRWESDINFKKYPVLTDKFIYQVLRKNKNIKNETIELILNQEVEQLNIMGGEPLLYKNLFHLIKTSKVKNLGIITNLMVDKPTLDKLLELENFTDKITISCSIDCTEELAEFVRHGLIYKKFIKNLEYLISKINRFKTKIQICSLLTGITIFGIKDLHVVLEQINKKHNIEISWIISYCENPKIHSFAVLPNTIRKCLINNLNSVFLYPNMVGLETSISHLTYTSFNKQIAKELNYFLKEWTQRKNVKIPKIIKENLCLE